MTIRFTKMHGLGNDFMVIDAIHQKINLDPTQVRALSRRDTGVGFDQCLLVEKSKDPEIDFFYRIFNADGQEVGQCGNGARCLARFVLHYGLTQKKNIAIATYTTKMRLQLNEDNSVTVEFPRPKLNPSEIPLMVNESAKLYRLPLSQGSSCEIHAINVGNPHAVMRVDALANLDLSKLGKEISEHSLFPEQTNAGFMQIVDENHLRLRVFERGCGETKACGSGALAAAAAGRLWHQMAKRIQVSLTGGDLYIDWPDTEGPIYLTGPSSFVYEGVVFTEKRK